MEKYESTIEEIRTKDAGELLGVTNQTASAFAKRGLIEKTRHGWVEKESVLKLKADLDERRSIEPAKWVNPVHV